MQKNILVFFIAAALQLTPASAKVEEVKIDPGVFSLDKGYLNEATAVILLNNAYRQNLLSQSDQHFPNPQCLKAKNLGAGGAVTVRLFAIQVSDVCLRDGSPSHHDYHTIFILKEMGKGMSEANNLDVVKESELSSLEISKAHAEGLPGLAFHHQNLSYKDQGGKSHVLSLLYAAAGHEVKSLENQLATYHRAASQSNDIVDLKEYQELKARLSNAFYQTGVALARMHFKYMEPAGEIFGLTHVHADLHMENVFVAGDKVTFIDNETFTISLKTKQPVSVDVMRFLMFTIAHPAKRYRHSVDIPADVWRKVAVTPFIQGYVDGYPVEKRNEARLKLKDLLLNVSEAELLNAWRGAGGNASLLGKAKTDYLIPAFREIH